MKDEYPYIPFSVGNSYKDMLGREVLITGRVDGDIVMLIGRVKKSGTVLKYFASGRIISGNPDLRLTPNCDDDYTFINMLSDYEDLKDISGNPTSRVNRLAMLVLLRLYDNDWAYPLLRTAVIKASAKFKFSKDEVDFYVKNNGTPETNAVA